MIQETLYCCNNISGNEPGGAMIVACFAYGGLAPSWRLREHCETFHSKVLARSLHKLAEYQFVAQLSC
uniref:Uncharacterized protein n=1 Tax=mine drainage metagenome TaxID=410659 RepID=E6QVL6_9ZZZZ